MRKLTFSDLKNKHFLAFTGNVVLAVLGIVIMGLLYRSMNKADIGVWFFFLTIYSLGDAIRNGFLQTGCIKFYTGTDKETADKVLGSVWYLALVISAVLVAINLIAFCFTGFITNEALLVSIQWFAITYLSALPFTIMFWILLADERYDQILILRLVNSGSMIIYIIVLILIHRMSLPALLWCNFLTNCLASAVGAIMGLGKFRTLAKRSGQHIRELAHFGKFSFGSTVVSRLLGSTDAFLITAFMGPAALAIFNVPMRLMEIVEIPLRTFVSTGLSGMATALNTDRKDQVVSILNKYAGILTIAFIPLTILALIFAQIPIYLLAGGKYVGTEAANIYRVFMVICLFYPIDRFSGLTLDVLHKPKLNFYKTLLMLICSVCGDLAGYAIFGNLYGFCCGTSLTVVAGLSFAYLHLNKYIRFSFKDILATGVRESAVIVNKFLSRGRGVS